MPCWYLEGSERRLVCLQYFLLAFEEACGFFVPWLSCEHHASLWGRTTSVAMSSTKNEVAQSSLTTPSAPGSSQGHLGPTFYRHCQGAASLAKTRVRGKYTKSANYK